MVGRVFYNKLIRDGIKDKIEKNGEACSVRIIDDESEFEQELLKKVAEEAGELSLARSRQEFIDEYADLMVVLDTLTRRQEISEGEIKIALEENLRRKGRYDKRHFLEWSSDTGHQTNGVLPDIKS